MLQVLLSRGQIIQIVHSLTQLKIDDLVAIHAMAPYSESLADIVEEKASVVVGSEKEYKIVGVTFEGRQEVIKLLTSGEVLHFERQPENEHDPNAIAVKRQDGSQIGYLPKDLAVILCDTIHNLDGIVVNVLGNDASVDIMEEPKFLGVRFKFIRKSNNHGFIAINLDAVDMAVDPVRGTSIEVDASKEIERIAKSQHQTHEKKAHDHISKDVVDNVPHEEPPPEDEILF